MRPPLPPPKKKQSFLRRNNRRGTISDPLIGQLQRRCSIEEERTQEIKRLGNERHISPWHIFFFSRLFCENLTAWGCRSSHRNANTHTNDQDKRKSHTSVVVLPHCRRLDVRELVRGPRSSLSPASVACCSLSCRVHPSPTCSPFIRSAPAPPSARFLFRLSTGRTVVRRRFTNTTNQ